MSAVKTIGIMDFMKNSRCENRAAGVLQTELEKGFWSAKNEEVYTIEEAWEEIDKI